MVPEATIVGVHPVPGSEEPVHLIEMMIRGDPARFDFGLITQRISDTPRSEWQVPYDERVLGPGPDDWTRVAFFFHFLDLTKPLETPAGTLELPTPTDAPPELAVINYEAPC